MTPNEWKEMTEAEKQTYLELLDIIEKENRSLLRSYRYWSNKKEKEDENEE
jgi:DNA replication initiation complex subunit (GINS family)